MAILALLSFLVAPSKPVVRMAFGGLAHVCARESRCTPVGIHSGDAHHGKTVYANAVRAGWLDRGCIFHHGSPERFSTRGTAGLMAGYHLRFLPGCLPPEVLDLPLVSAYVAHRKAESEACSRHPRCVSWRGGAS
jgi:hypothetical protein